MNSGIKSKRRGFELIENPMIQKEEEKFIKQVQKTTNEKHKKNIFLKKGKKRGPYRKYNLKDRKEAIDLAISLDNPILAAERLNIPIKNLKRWLKAGPERKKGGTLIRR